MPVYINGDVTIHHEESGSGLPVLLFAPGLMRSSIARWEHSDLKPSEVLADGFRVIAMDQRNAGKSTEPIRATDTWVDYARDAIGLIDYLGLDRLAIWGRCIGPSFCMKVIDKLGGQAGRIAAFVDHAVSTPSIAATTCMVFTSGLRSCQLEPSRSRQRRPDVRVLCETLFGGDFVFSVNRDFVRAIHTPMLVLPGRDPASPRPRGRGDAVRFSTRRVRFGPAPSTCTSCSRSRRASTRCASPTDS
jgi:pimeloyl-ACP methyl ester carboxylesterase